MEPDLDQVAGQRVRQFFAFVSSLPPAQVSALSQLPRGRAVTRLGLGVDPAYLTAVASGAWTQVHESLACEVKNSARAVADRLAPFGRRRRMARVLEDAALAVLSEADPAGSLPSSLRDRLAAPWTEAVGICPVLIAAGGVSKRRPA